MIMKTTIYLCLTFLSGFLSGCNSDCCDCDTQGDFEQGNLRLIRNWDQLWKGLEKPQRLDVYFYNPYQDLQYFNVEKDTTNLFLNAGEYYVLAINDASTVTGIGNYNTAKISLPCRKVNDKHITSEAPLIIATSSIAYVDENKTSECLLFPSPAISIINFRFDIKADSLIGEIKQCKAELHNVTTSRMLSGEEDKESNTACLPFTAFKTTEGYFEKRISILGLSGDGNILELSILFENESKNMSIDLTNLFDFTLSPIQNCVIQINLSGDRVIPIIENITIADWDQGIDDNIELK